MTDTTFNSQDPFGHDETTFIACEVYASAVNPNTGYKADINGVLSVVEKPDGIYIEWKPAEINGTKDDEDIESWVIEGDQKANSPPSPTKSLGMSYNALVFSTDLNHLRSFTFEDPSNGIASVKFICKDGTTSNVLSFKAGGYTEFVTHIQKYLTLNRSSKERNLVMVVDPREDLLEKSVAMLDLNKDIVSRVIKNPYRSTLTMLAKVTDFMQPLLDPEAVVNENHIRAMHMLNPEQEECAKKLRSHNEDGFEHFFHLDLPERPKIPGRDASVDEKVFNDFRGKDGVITDSHALKSLIFRGGIEKSLRPLLWKYLLGYYDWKKTSEENQLKRKQLSDDYYRMKLQWVTLTNDQESRFADFRDRKALIEKDVQRTDRSHSYFRNEQNLDLMKDILMTYIMFDFDLGYVQGMSDFLGPIMVIMEDEVDSFWSFVGLMKRVHSNFEMDQLAIKKQLTSLKSLIEIINPRLINYLEGHESDHMYFVFRWILVNFKREFTFENIMYLWEVLWTDIPCKNFLLIICAAILDGETSIIIANNFGLTEILKHVNNLSMKMDLRDVLLSAEAIYHQLAAVQDKLPKHVCEIIGFSYDETQDRNKQLSPAKDKS
ncbi:hypothetical protein M3Y97_00507600 [Aphelenchoides bicaudatus]|nr:hypothetical protein M3Y97_00507600 [Aphelenchoides bicaudatus]